jgi:hypothetical protein
MIGTIVAKVPTPVIDSLTKNVPIIESIAKHLGNTWVFLIVIFLMLILFVAVLLFKGKLKLKLPGGAEIDISGGNDKSDKKPDNKKPQVDHQPQPPPTVLLGSQSVHANCPHVVDFKHVVTKTTYVVSKISEIEYKGCLSEQMGHVEEQFINIRTVFQKLYLEKLREKLEEKGEAIKKEEEYLYEDYKFYQALVKLMLHDMEAIIRASFANNHLTDYDMESYQKYIDLKFNVIKGLESDFLDTMYIGDWVISRKDVFDLHRRSRVEIKEIIQNIYLNAQKIAIAKAKEIDELQDELQEFLDETVSGSIRVERTG